jgi:hypothetical protein
MEYTAILILRRVSQDQSGPDIKGGVFGGERYIH